MILQAQSDNISDYLEKTSVIDFDHSEIIALSESLNRSSLSESDHVKRIYEYVRDEISHTADIGGKLVTCKASDVLIAEEGTCFAKSHLLAAILRHHKIPAGFCYQLLKLDDEKSPLVIHGLNGVYLNSLQRWIRLDARGNKHGVNAQFSVDTEILAFPVREELGEVDYPIVYCNPDPGVLDAMALYRTFEEFWTNLPKNFRLFERTHT